MPYNYILSDELRKNYADLLADNIVIFDETPTDTQYQDALVIIQNMSKVVDTLFTKTKKLS